MSLHELSPLLCVLQRSSTSDSSCVCTPRGHPDTDCQLYYPLVRIANSAYFASFIATMSRTSVAHSMSTVATLFAGPGSAANISGSVHVCISLSHGMLPSSKCSREIISRKMWDFDLFWTELYKRCRPMEFLTLVKSLASCSCLLWRQKILAMILPQNLSRGMSLATRTSQTFGIRRLELRHGFPWLAPTPFWPPRERLSPMRWCSFSHIRTSPGSLLRLLILAGISTTVISGRKTTIIPSTQFLDLQQQLSCVNLPGSPTERRTEAMTKIIHPSKREIVQFDCSR